MLTVTTLVMKHTWGHSDLDTGFRDSLHIVTIQFSGAPAGGLSGYAWSRAQDFFCESVLHMQIALDFWTTHFGVATQLRNQPICTSTLLQHYSAWLMQECVGPGFSSR